MKHHVKYENVWSDNATVDACYIGCPTAFGSQHNRLLWQPVPISVRFVKKAVGYRGTEGAEGVRCGLGRMPPP